MQPLTWYLRRLSAMSPAEVASRAVAGVRDGLDALRVGAGWTPRPPTEAAGERAALDLCDVVVGEWTSATPGSPEAGWRDRLVRAADEIAAQRLRFFDVTTSPPIDWNRDAKSGRCAPLRFGRWVDYRDHALAGDCKFVWEPNRHHHLVVLARAFRATGNERYARAAAEQVESWLDACPFGRGMNWRSTLELGIRLINWTWTLDLLRGSGQPAEPLRSRLLASMYEHLWEITRRYSEGSSANNHLVGEAAGAFVATACYPALDPGGRWHGQSRRILAREILRQSHEDGGTREQAIGYQVFVLQFYLVVDRVARGMGRPMPASYEERLERMLGFLAAFAEGGGRLPAFGDADDGYVLDLGGGAEDWRSWLGVGAARFSKPELARAVEGSPEAVRWLLGRAGEVELSGLVSRAGAKASGSRALPDSGYYLLLEASEARASVVFDCGELGFDSIAAHGHADALSFVLRAFGEDVLVDPGTYDYFTYPQWRCFFRSTRAHNTVEIDGLDQSTMSGPFLWGQRARARCLAWEPAADGGRVSGEHDGYGRLPDPVTHRRTLELSGNPPVLVVADEIVARGAHEVALRFHVSEDAEVTSPGEGVFDIRLAGGVARLAFDPALRVEALCGSVEPPAGWVSRGYHRRKPSTTLVGRTRSEGLLSLVCRVELLAGRDSAHSERGEA